MDRNIIDLGFVQIKWYSFLILLAIIVAYLIVSKETKKKKLNENDFLDMAFYGIIIGILGARVYYVLFNLNYYLRFPLEIPMVWNGGLAIHGGLIAALIFLTFYTRKKKLDLLLLLDTIVVGLIIAQAIGRWGNFFNQEAYGRIVSKSYLEYIHIPEFIIKGMYIKGDYREPTFLYESFFSTIGFLVLILVRKIKSLKTGALTSIYLLWYGISRFIIEAHRADSLMLRSIRVAQLVSIISIISGIVLFIISIKKQQNYNKSKFVTTQ